MPWVFNIYKVKDLSILPGKNAIGIKSLEDDLENGEKEERDIREGREGEEEGGRKEGWW